MVKRKQRGRVSSKVKAARMLGSLGGRAGTTKQNEARKRNAQRAGRPRRVCIACNEPVVGGHVDRRLDTSCGAHGWRWQRRDDPHDSTVDRSLDRALMAAFNALPQAARMQVEQEHAAALRVLRDRVA